MSTTLVLGGARSGKSAHAERLAAQSGKDVIYIATAYAGDGEMAARISHHRSGRPASWTTVEEPVLLADAIARHSTPASVVLVDCLTLWLSNLMFSDGRNYPDTGMLTLPPLFDAQRAALLDILRQPPGDIVLVSNEVGMGIVPMGAVSRTFAAACERVLFIAAGLPLTLKAPPC